LEELERVSQSIAFRRSDRLYRLLFYAASLSLANSQITERMAGHYLFGDGADFNPSLDPTVRVLFGRLRKRLESYYRSEGAQNPIRISIPERNYNPVFEAAPNAAGKLAAEAAVAGEAAVRDAGNGCKQSLAVLPFLNLTNDPEQEVYCAGITDELISALAGVPTVDVVARSSAFQFQNQPVDVRTVGNELGVDLILEGSVKIENDQTRITAQLAKVKDGFALWANSYNGTGNAGMGSVTQAEIAQEIVHTLPLDPAVGR
jgi:TolB-like protein